MVHSHTVHLPRGALLSPCTMCVAQARRRRWSATASSPSTSSRTSSRPCRRGTEPCLPISPSPHLPILPVDQLKDFITPVQACNLRAPASPDPNPTLTPARTPTLTPALTPALTLNAQHLVARLPMHVFEQTYALRLRTDAERADDADAPSLARELLMAHALARGFMTSTKARRTCGPPMWPLPLRHR